MTNLERLALLGNKKAQEDCTEKGILLPCPMCKGKASVKHHPEWGWSQYEVFCENCGLSFNIAFSEPKDAIKAWNRRYKDEIN